MELNAKYQITIPFHLRFAASEGNNYVDIPVYMDGYLEVVSLICWKGTTTMSSFHTF